MPDTTTYTGVRRVLNASNASWSTILLLACSFSTIANMTPQSGNELSDIENSSNVCKVTTRELECTGRYIMLKERFIAMRKAAWFLAAHANQSIDDILPAV